MSFYTSPELAPEAVQISRAIVESFAHDGPSKKEMEVVRKQVGELVTRAQRDPKYWTRVLGDLDYHDIRLDDLKTLSQRIRDFTADELKTVLQKYIVDEGRFEVICVPSQVQ